MTIAVRPVHPSVSRDPIALDAKDAPTVCVLCSHNCGLRVDVEDGRITDVRADEANPITHGYVCNKGFEIVHYVEHAQRLTHPLRRRADGTFEEIDWDTAIEEIGSKLRQIRDDHAPRAIGLVGIGGQGNHMDAPFGISWLQAVGSPCWYNAFAQEKHQHALIDHWLFDAAPTVFFHPDLDGTRCALVMGTNPKISNRGHAATDTFKALQKDPNCNLIVVDPRETETTRGANRHVRVKPGTDAYFLLALAAVISSAEGLADAEFIATRTTGFEELRAALAEVDVDELAKRAGLQRDEIEAVARDFATADSAAIMFDLAVEHAPFSTLISYLVRVLSVLTGNAGKRGGNVFIEAAVPPHRSPKRFEEPVRALASGIQAISALGGFPMFSPTLVPEEILVDHPERLRALVVEGSNPWLSFSDTSRWREARSRLDLLVVIEPAMTESAREADYVLPAPVGYEKWEQSMFPKGYPEVYVQLRPPVVPPLGETLPEPEIYARLVEAMGLVGEPPAKLHELARNALTPDGAMAYLGELMTAAAGSSPSVLFWAYRTLGPLLPAPSLVAVFANCHENAFQRPAGVLRTLGPEWEGKSPFELAAELFRRILAHPEGVEIAKADADHILDANIGWDDKRIRLAPPPMLAEIARADVTELPRDPDYPFVLGGGLRTRWTANTIQRNPAWRKGRGPHCSLHLSPADAGRLGVKAGEVVRVSTRRGSVELPAELDKNVSEGHVWIPNGFGMRYPNAQGELEAVGVNINELSDARDRDPISGCPQHKYTLCRVERAA
jgi:anaerobic selenocysteine-containing dehydrogenase